MVERKRQRLIQTNIAIKLLILICFCQLTVFLLDANMFTWSLELVDFVIGRVVLTSIKLTDGLL